MEKKRKKFCTSCGVRLTKKNTHMSKRVFTRVKKDIVIPFEVVYRYPHAKCKECRCREKREYYQKHKEHYKKLGNEYYHNHKEQFREYYCKYREHKAVK